MIAYSHKEEADTKGNSRDPQKKEPVHHRKITRKQKRFFIPGNSKKKKKPSMKDFPKAPEKFREAKGTDFGKRQFHPRKPKQETKTEKLGSP